MRKSIILIVALIASLNISAQTKEKQDSLNIPVFLVDGVEVQNIDNLDQKDIISVNVIKNGDFNKLFLSTYWRRDADYNKIKKISEAYHSKVSGKYEESKE